MASSTVARLSATFRIDGIPAAQAQLRSIDKSMSATAKNIGQQTQTAAKATTGFSSSLTNAASGAMRFGAGAGVATAAVVAATAAFKATVAPAAAYEKSLNVLRATSGATASEMSMVSNTAKALGADTNLAGVSASTAANAMLELSKSGLSVTDTMGAARGVLQLATAGEISAGEAAQIAAAQLNAFSLQGSEAGRVADLLAAAANASQSSVQQLGTGMAQASAVFASAGYTVEDLVTSMALMANRGVQGSDAATSLKTAILRLEAPTDKAAGLMSELGINVRNAQGNMLPMDQLVAHLTERLNALGPAQRDAAMATIFGTDAIRAAQIVFSQGATAYGEMAAKVTEAGAAQKLAEAQTQGLSGAWSGLQSNAETLGLTIGELATGPLTQLVEAATFIVGGLTNVATNIGRIDDMLGDNPGVQKMIEDYQRAKQAIQEFANVLLSLETPVGTVRDVINNLRDAYESLPMPVKALINPLHETINALQQQSDATKDTAQSNKQLADLWGGAAASSGKTYADTLKNMQKNGADASEQAGFLRTEHERLTGSVTSLWKEVQKESAAFDGNFEAAQKNSQAFRDANAAYVGTQQSLQTVNGLLGQMGLQTYTAADGTTHLTGKLRELPGAAQGAGGAAASMAPLEERLAGIRQKADDAYKALRKLIDAPTNVELAVTTQLSNVQATLSNVNAGFLTTGQTQQDFFARAGQHAQQTGLVGDALDRVNGILDQARSGTLTQAQAVAQLDAVFKPHATTLEAVGTAYSDTRDAVGNSTEQMVNDHTKVAGSMEQWESRVQSAANEVIGAVQEEERVIAQSTENINQSMGGIAGPEVVGPVQSNVEQIGDVFGTGLTDPAEAAKEGANQVLRDIGAGEVIGTVQGNTDAIGAIIEPGITPGAEAAKTSVDTIVGNMLTGGVPGQVASNMQTVIDAIKQTAGLGDLTPEAQQIISTMAQGLLAGSSNVVGNMQAIIGHLRAAANVNLSAEGRQAAASFAAGLMAGISEARVQAAMLASAPVTAVDQRLDMGSPSKVMIQRGEWVGQGFAVGIANSAGESVTATRQMSDDSISVLEDSVNRFNSIIDSGMIDSGLYASGLKDLTDNFYAMSGAIRELEPDLSKFIPVQRQLANESQRIELEIKKLNRELADTDPYSDRAAAIKADIQVLEAWNSKVTDNISLMKLEQEVLEQSKTAYDGVIESRAKLAQAATNKTAFGEDAAKIFEDLDTVFAENTPEAGAAATNTVNSYLESVKEQLGSRFPEISDEVWRLFEAAVSAPTPEAREAAVNGLRSLFSGVQAEATAAATLTADTFNAALANAQMTRQLEETIGPQFTSFFDKLKETVKTGGESNIAEIGVMVDGIQQQLTKLPEFIRGQLGTEWSSAWEQFLSNPSETSVDRLQEVARRIHQATEVIPQNLESLIPEMQEAAKRLWEQVDQGTLPIEKAKERLDAMLKLLPSEFGKASQFTKSEILGIIKEFENLQISAEEAGDKISAAMSKAASNASGPFAEIDAAIQRTIDMFLKGILTAEEYAAAMSNLQGQAAGVARSQAKGPQAQLHPNLQAISKFAGGGAIDRHTYLMDARSGTIWGEMAEGDKREYIINEAQKRSLTGYANGSFEVTAQPGMAVIESFHCLTPEQEEEIRNLTKAGQRLYPRSTPPANPADKVDPIDMGQAEAYAAYIAGDRSQAAQQAYIKAVNSQLNYFRDQQAYHMGLRQQQLDDAFNHELRNWVKYMLQQGDCIQLMRILEEGAAAAYQQWNPSRAAMFSVLSSGERNTGNMWDTILGAHGIRGPGTGVQSGLGIPGLADGGIVKADTMAMLHGKNDPEVVSPLSKLPGLIQGMGTGNNSSDSDSIVREIRLLSAITRQTVNAIRNMQLQVGTDQFGQIVNKSMTNYILERGLPE